MRENRLIKHWFWIFLALAGARAWASDPKFPVELEGRVDLQLKTEDRFSQVELDNEGQVEVATRRREGVRAVTEFNVSPQDGGIELREFFLDFKSERFGRWEMGQAKKRFGLDAEQNLEDRLTLGRGAVFRKLGGFQYVGRDVMVGVRNSETEGLRNLHSLSLHSSEGTNASMLYGFRRRVGEFGMFASDSLAQVGVVDHEWHNAGAQAISYRHRDPRFRAEAELIFGHDPIETEYRVRQGDRRTLFFGSWSVGGSVRWGRFEPFLKTAALQHDLQRWSDRTYEGVLGARFHIQERLIFGVEGNLQKTLGHAAESSPDVPEFDSTSHALMTLRYFF